jgi:glutamyl-tRNA synthetase
MSAMVRVRFAPSPTGYLHVGGARTALFDYLFARHHNGTFILRIEDTDRNRFHQGALEEIFSSLRWLGITWDEGPQCGGEYGPYVQSKRLELYKEKVQILLDNGYAYRCFCTTERLRKIREEQQKQKKLIGYDRHCRDLSEIENNKLLHKNQPSVIRFKVPFSQEIVFNDLIRGEIKYRSNLLDDFVLLKSDGYPTYHLANVVDDSSMKISHVLRGDEWITSTPLHILLYDAFGWKPPLFAHTPPILSSSGGKLSKRKGAASVMDYMKDGFLPETLFNFLALLGWSPGDDREKMSRNEMVEAFSLKKISPKSCVFDEKKLDWMNGLYLQERSVESIRKRVIQLWRERGFISDDSVFDDTYFDSVIALLKDRSKKINDIAVNSKYFFLDPDTYEEKAVRKHWKGNTKSIIQTLAAKLEHCESFDHITLENIYKNYCEESGLSAGKLIHPTRLAISGVSFGPGLFELLEVVGKEAVIRRMKAAVDWLNRRDQTE